MIELKNSKLTRLGRRRYALDAFIGAVQMRESEGEWQDIKPRLVRGADGWQVEDAPYYAEVKDDGSRLFCPDRNERSKHLWLPTTPLLRKLTKNIISNPTKLDGQMLPNVVIMPLPWGEIRFIFTNTGLKFEVLMREAPPKALKDRFAFDLDNVGFDIQKLIIEKQGLGIPRPRLIDANDVERWLDWSYKAGQLELGFDLTGLRFPILLKNTTIDKQIGYWRDDGLRCTGTLEFSQSYNTMWIGYNTASNLLLCHTYYRFIDITGLESATITTSYISLHGAVSSDGSPLTKVYADDQASPGYPGNATEFDAIELTTASVDWDGQLNINEWNNSPSLNAVIQELADSYNPTVIQIMHKDDGSSDADDNCQKIHSYDYDDNTYGPKLHVEYTPAPYELSCTDGLKVGDTNQGSLILNLALTDGLKGGESTEQPITIPKSLTDGLKLGDSSLAGLFYSLLVTDGIKFSETLATLLETNPALTDGIKLSEGESIDVGAGAIDRGASFSSGWTVIGIDNPANIDGTITCVEIWANENISGLIVGTFYTTNGNTLKCRDSEAIAGTITAGSKVTKAVTITVKAGDYIGAYWTGGIMERDAAGAGGAWSKFGDFTTPGDEQDYSFLDGDAISLYGTGFGAPLAQLETSLALIDGLKLGDSTLAGLFYNLLASDGLKLGDSNAILKTLYLLLADGVKLSEALAAQLETNPSLTDGIKLSEALATVCNLNVSLTDGVKLGDFVDLFGRLLKLITYARPYSNLIVFMRPHSKLQTYVRPHSDLRTYTSEVEQK